MHSLTVIVPRAILGVGAVANASPVGSDLIRANLRGYLGRCLAVNLPVNNSIQVESIFDSRMTHASVVETVVCLGHD